MGRLTTLARRLRSGAAAAVIGAALLAPLTATPAHAASGDDWLSTQGNTIVDSAGNEVWLTGVNWFGFNTSERVFHGLWAANIEQVTSEMAARGLNIVRVPISTELLLEWENGQAGASDINEYINPELAGMTTLEIFDYWLGLCEEYGLKVMIDVHSAEADNSGHFYPVWYKGAITTEDFYSAWEWITERYKNNDTIVAADIKNEPHGTAADSPRAKWDGSTDVDNFKHVCETAGNRILDINPNMLILCEGIEIYPKDGQNWSSTDEKQYHSTWWGGNLRGVADHPVDLGSRQNQLVYSPHDYGPTVFMQDWFEGDWDKQTLTEDVWRPNWLYIHEEDTAPLLIGEWGGFLDGGDNQKWMEALRGLIVENGLHHTFWVLNPNSGDTGGLLGYDWTTWDEAKYAFLKPALWQHEGKFVGLDHQVPLGSSATGLSLNEVYGGGSGPIDPDDDQAPTAPSGLTVTGTTSTGVSLSWTASTDNVGVTGYAVHRDGVQVATVTGTSYTDTGLSPGTDYSYTVTARDAADNESTPSAAVIAQTLDAPAGELKVRYRNNDGSPSDNQISPGLQLVNTGSAAVDLADVEVRYYFTGDGGNQFQFMCDWAQIDCANVTGGFGSLSAPGADAYLSLSFVGSLAPGSSTEIQGRIHKSDWSNFDETDDYSWSTDTSWVDAPAVTAHISDALVWGQPPA